MWVLFPVKVINNYVQVIWYTLLAAAPLRCEETLHSVCYIIYLLYVFKFFIIYVFAEKLKLV